MSRVYSSVSQIDFEVCELETIPRPERVLLARPTHFDIAYEINPFMVGNIGKADLAAALRQWEAMRDGFERVALEVIELEGQDGLPDMVFTANQALPFADRHGNKKAVMAIMCHEQRQGEIPHAEQWFRRNGYEVIRLEDDGMSRGKPIYFEGAGDAILHQGRRLIWGGYGVRSTRPAFDQISEQLDVPVVLLELHDERFYHLDTCFCCLDEWSVLVHPPALTEESMEMVRRLFTNVIEADPSEAKTLLAANAVSVNGADVFISKGCVKTAARLAENGYRVHEIDTSEFQKSGGSVYCMKLLVW